MKKILFIGFIAIILGVLMGFVIYKFSIKDSNKFNVEKLSTNITNEAIVLNGKNEIIEVTKKEVKVSPKATLITKKFYKSCSHTIEDYTEVPYDIVNKTEVEIKNIFSDYIIESFSEKEIIIKKEIDGICNEHYVLRELDGSVAIYILDEFNNENLVQITEISTKYLPDVDLYDLKKGIFVKGRAALNRAIEDFE